jgi:lipopolysaccharide transport system permease protein
LLLLPLLLFNAGFLGMSLGLIVSSLTTKYRDFSFVITVVVQGLMYLSTVIYPLSSVDNPIMHRCIELNPMTWVIDAFRTGCFGDGQVSYMGLLYATAVTLMLTFVGIIMFSKTEKTFIDTV